MPLTLSPEGTDITTLSQEHDVRFDPLWLAESTAAEVRVSHRIKNKEPRLVGHVSSRQRLPLTPDVQPVALSAHAARALDARRARLSVSTDIQFLRNRIARLRVEEQRARLDAETARKKACGILLNKEQYDKSRQRKELAQEVAEAEQRKEAAMIALDRERQYHAVSAAKQRIVLEKRRLGQETRAEHKVHHRQRTLLLQEAHELNVKQRAYIRSMESVARARKAQLEEQRREENLAQYQTRIESEVSVSEKKEHLARALLAKEAVLVQRLYEAHHERAGALRELVEVIDTRNVASAVEDPCSVFRDGYAGSAVRLLRCRSNASSASRSRAIAPHVISSSQDDSL